MSKGDTVEFTWNYVMYRGTYLGFNGKADIVRVGNLYFWI